jgi:hypothetical protein
LAQKVVQLTIDNPSYSSSELAYLYAALIRVTQGQIKRYIWKQVLSRPYLTDVFYNILIPREDNLFRVTEFVIQNTDNVEVAAQLFSRLPQNIRSDLLSDNDILSFVISSEHFNMFNFLLGLFITDYGQVPRRVVNSLISEIDGEPLNILFKYIEKVPFIKTLAPLSHRINSAIQLYNQRIEQTASYVADALPVPRDVIMYDLKYYLSALD